MAAIRFEEKQIDRDEICAECGKHFRYNNVDARVCEGIIASIKVGNSPFKASFYLCNKCNGKSVMSYAGDIWEKQTSDFTINYAEIPITASN